MARQTAILGFVGALMLLFATTAQAKNDGVQGERAGGNSAENRRNNEPRAVPEFDPAALGAVAAIVAGGALMLARRRRS